MCLKQNWRTREQSFLRQTDRNLEQKFSCLEFGFSYGEPTEIQCRDELSQIQGFIWRIDSTLKNFWDKNVVNRPELQ